MNLLEELQVLARAEFISNLLNLNLKKEVDAIQRGKYALDEWTETVCYLTRQKNTFFQDEQEARQFYLEWVG